MDLNRATTKEEERFERFRTALAGQGKSANTLKAYRSDRQHLARWFVQTNGEPLDLTRLTGIDISDYRLHKQRQGRAASTINRRLAFIKRYTRWANQVKKLAADAGQRCGKCRFCVGRRWRRGAFRNATRVGS